MTRVSGWESLRSLCPEKARWVGNHVIDHHLARKKEPETETETSRP